MLGAAAQKSISLAHHKYAFVYLPYQCQYPRRLTIDPAGVPVPVRSLDFAVLYHGTISPYLLSKVSSFVPVGPPYRSFIHFIFERVAGPSVPRATDDGLRIWFLGARYRDPLYCHRQEKQPRRDGGLAVLVARVMRVLRSSRICSVRRMGAAILHRPGSYF